MEVVLCRGGCMLQEFLSRFHKTGALAIVYLALGMTGFGQVTSSTIHGIVHDPSGAVIPSANLKLTDTSTGITHETTASGEGTFVFADLIAATYQLTTSAAGFQNNVLNGIVVDTGRTTDVQVTMIVGSTTDTVEVAATGVQLETTSNEVGTTINNKS